MALCILLLSKFQIVPLKTKEVIIKSDSTNENVTICVCGIFWQEFWRLSNSTNSIPFFFSEFA